MIEFNSGIYNSANAINTLLQSKGLSVQKKFGQNFLINPSMRQKIFDAAEVENGTRVWEIGPGLGAETLSLLEAGARLTAFEIDNGYCKLLNSLFAERFTADWTLVEGDVLKTWQAQAEREHITCGGFSSANIILFGNLPYNIAGILTGTFIENGLFFKRCVLTVQKEVAERFSAAPGTPQYSSLSVLCSSVYTVKRVSLIPPHNFSPPPHVDSICLRLDLQPDIERVFAPFASAENAAKRLPGFFRMVRVLFSHRRKTIKNNLEAVIQPEIAAAALKNAHIDSQIRAETLAPADFIKLYAALPH
ncbi:MAG: 16S rRNA (adenine(1518)-N(6)/adenine(1519)-N(6))-dimethyltransferase RsmA [Spirochaetaceae bacterium]|jgi:16S rRNA (adenine1518-N6/adenine1519-N6)-dimethyltransferase|nr:16S rRNA (adenine(1518)-N(6)/adenine(1519)-N(6))-dimethyltransferase RsmA [Spirochaetaceae bacterium]